MQPLNSLILIEYIEPKEKKTEGGLYVPPSQDNKALGHLREGKVIEVNPEEKYIKPGQQILFNINAACYVPGDETKRFVRSEDIYAIK